jgi:hypothetical protein
VCQQNMARETISAIAHVRFNWLFGAIGMTPGLHSVPAPDNGFVTVTGTTLHRNWRSTFGIKWVAVKFK